MTFMSCPGILLMVGHIKNDPESFGLLSIWEFIPDKNVYLFFFLNLVPGKVFLPKNKDVCSFFKIFKK